MEIHPGMIEEYLLAVDAVDTARQELDQAQSLRKHLEKEIIRAMGREGKTRIVFFREEEIIIDGESLALAGQRSISA